MDTYITPDVIKVKALDDYLLEVTFKTKEIKIFDMKNLINNIEFYKRLKNKDFNTMEKQYKKIETELKELAPIENTINQARTIEKLHNLIKNNGQDFNLTKEQIELAEKLK